MLHNINLSFKEEMERRGDHATKYVVIHHSEVVSRHTAKDVHQWHLNKGWAGCGYHFFVDKDGEIFEARPVWAVGAHMHGYNKESVGICFEGDFNKEQMNKKQEDAAVMLVALLSLSYDNAKVVRQCDLSKEKAGPGANFPFEDFCQKVETCKSWMKSLSGSEVYQRMMDAVKA